MSIYEYEVEKANGEKVALSDFKGNVMIVVNTATGCGFTPQYKELESMYEQYHEKGLEIIDIPCNQFAGQTSGTDDEIHEFCTLKYHTQFPQMKKSDVNGAQELPLYGYLKSQQEFKGFGKGVKAMAMGAMMKKMDKNYKTNPDIKWNFTKFVVNRDGDVVARFEPTADMKELEECVKALI